MEPLRGWDNHAVQPPSPLTEPQQRILDDMLRDAAAGKRLVKIAGLAGTGKTTLIARLVQRLKGETLLCAPTGKAAGNLANRTGKPATTIASGPFKFVRAKPGKKGQQLLVIEPNPLFKPDFLIVDEASMISEKIGFDLEQRCSKTLFAFGDCGQLDPIANDDDPGTPWFVKPHYTLEKVMRQGPGSGIISQARRIRDVGTYDCCDPDDFHWEFEESPALLNSFDMVIAFSNADRQRVNTEIRKFRNLPPNVITPGEPLMAWRNQKYASVYNGTIVTVREEWTPGGPLKLTDHRGVEMNNITNPLIEGFNGLDFATFKQMKDQVNAAGKKRFMPFTLGYACTVHKAQGSEWGNVLIILRGDPDKEDRKFLYTAVTRARSRVTILHLDNAFGRAVRAYTPEEEEYDRRI